MSQYSLAQRMVRATEAHEEWSYSNRQRRKKLFEEGTIILEKSPNGVFCLKVKGWCVAVSTNPSKELRKVIDAVCDTITVMEEGGL